MTIKTQNGTPPQSDMFGEPRIQIPGNPLLEGLCNHLLRLIERDPELLTGDKVGIIDRKLVLAVWMEEGLNQILTGEQMEAFMEWAMDPKKCPDPEAISRARRYIVERDIVRLPKKAIENAEMHRQRISRSVKG